MSFVSFSLAVIFIMKQWKYSQKDKKTTHASRLQLPAEAAVLTRSAGRTGDVMQAS